MENIHSTIVELGTIFRQLAEMVQEQEEQVARWAQEERPCSPHDNIMCSVHDDIMCSTHDDILCSVHDDILYSA